MGYLSIDAVSWVAPPTPGREGRSTAAIAALHGNRVLIVADALGPRARASGAARHAVRAFGEAFPVAPHRVDGVETSVMAAMQAANSTLAPRERGTGNLIAPDAVALVAALFVEDRIVVAHAGNCRCSRVREGALTPMTRDHSVAEELRGETPQTTPEGSSDPFQIHYRDLITRGLGLDVSVQPEVTVSDCAVGDRYLLCTADVWAERLRDELATVLASAKDVQDASRALHTAADPRGIGGAFVLAELCPARRTPAG